MAIDANILFQAGRPTVQLDDPLNKLAQLGQVQGFQNQNALAQLQLKQAQQQDQDRTAQSQAWQDAIDPETGQPNYTKVIGNLARSGAGGMIPAVQKSAAEAQKAQREAEKAQLQQAIEKQSLISQYAGSATDQASWTAARNAVAQLGIDVSQVPEQFDPATAKQLQMRALTGVQQLDQHWKQQGYDLDVRKQNEVERNNKAQNSVAQGQLGVAQAGLGLRRQELEAGKVPPGYRRTSDGNLEAIPGGPADIKNSKEENQKKTDAKDVLGLLDEAESILPKATGGYIGMGIDATSRAFGKTTEGDAATARLAAIEGQLVGKMPKFSGPTSDRDAALYRQAAGDLANATLPVARRQAAADQVRRLNEKALGMEPGSSRKQAGPGTPPDINDLLKKYGG
jgi:hypothetical protein